MMRLPAKYAYLREDPLPPVMVRIALELLGVLEGPGDADNPLIIGWANEIARATDRPYAQWAADYFNKDSIPWCGLFLGLVAVRSSQGRPERMPPNNYLAALAWAAWGEPVDPDDIRVGDVVILVREGGGHVFIALGVSEDGRRIMGIGGNQSNAVRIGEFDRARIYAVRRPPYRTMPPGARRVVLAADGPVSIDEA